MGTSLTGSCGHRWAIGSAASLLVVFALEAVPQERGRDPGATRPLSTSNAGSVALQQGAPGLATGDLDGLQASELLCRGGGPYPSGRWGEVPGKPGAEWQRVYLAISPNPARSDGRGLAPNTCAFLDSVPTDFWSVMLTVTIGDSTLQDLQSYLADPGHYWSFLVRKNDTGAWYEASRHGKWIPPLGDTPLQQSPVGTAATTGDLAAAAAVATEDLICRGGPTLRFENRGVKPDSATTAIVQLFFGAPGRNLEGRRPAAEADGVYLEPGTCAFTARDFIVGKDWAGIQFETAAGETDAQRSAASSPDSNSIPPYMQEKRHFWRFSVYDTGYGYFQATRHGVWKPSPPPGPPDFDEHRTPYYPAAGGGAVFDRACPPGFYLAGVDLRIGDDMDAVRPICGRLLPEGSRGELDYPAFAGGSGGEARSLLCPAAKPFVRGLDVKWEGVPDYRTFGVDGVELRCGRVQDDPLPPEQYVSGYDFLTAAGGWTSRPFLPAWDEAVCAAGFSHAGIHGRSGLMVDALGSVCREIVGVWQD